MWFCRYKLRQFAERLPDGTVPITGFNTLQCPSSEHDYARTIARCLFFLSRQKKIEPYSSNLEAVYLRKVDPQHLERMSAVQALLFAGLSEASTNAPIYSVGRPKASSVLSEYMGPTEARIISTQNLGIVSL